MRLWPGNEVRLLIDGPQTFNAMFAAISRARDHVNLGTFIIRDDATGRTLQELLLQRQSAGVHVNMIYDSLGALRTPKAFFEQLRHAGASVCEFNPLALCRRLTRRYHRKVLVVDGAVAYTGGVNIDSVYATGSSTPDLGKATLRAGWRDTHLEIRGPAVAQVQRLFLDTWMRQTGASPRQRDYYPKLCAVGRKVVGILGSGSSGVVNEIYASLLSAVNSARRRILITMAYFAPNNELMDALIRAASRGVQVKLLLPGFSDSWCALHAGRSHYRTLLVSGVEIYEHDRAMLHAKTAVIDAYWATVGSTNLDRCSLLRNEEMNAVIIGEEFAREMETTFYRDCAASVRVNAQEWNRRPRVQRIREWVARRVLNAT